MSDNVRSRSAKRSAKRPPISPNIVPTLFWDLYTYIIHVKLFHYYTEQYHAHQVSDKLYTKLQKQADRLIESLIGQGYEKQKYGDSEEVIFELPSEITIVRMTNDLIQSLQLHLYKFNAQKYNSGSKAAIAIIEEILETLSQFLYLMKMV